MPSIGAAPLRPSIRPSQYSPTVLPRGFRVPIPVTTTRRSPFLLKLSPPHGAAAAPSPPNLTDQARLNRLLGNADGILDRGRVGAAVCHHGDAVDAQERSPTELAPVEPRADPADAAPDQEATELAPGRARDLLPQRPEDELGGRLGHLDGEVAHEAVRDHHVGLPGQRIPGLHVADEDETAQAHQPGVDVPG